MEGAGVEGGSEEAKRIKDRGVNEEDGGVEGNKGKNKRRRKSGEVHNATSESSVDEDRLGKGRHS